MSCPTELELAHARSVGLDAEQTAHLADCAECRAEWDATSRMIELAREVPVPIPSSEHREEVRTALLAAPPATRGPATHRRWWIPAAIGVAAAAAAAALLIPRGEPAPTISQHSHGDVRPQPGAHYIASSRSPDEVVRLFDGAIDVEVAPLHAGERFRVVVGDAEVEVRGTAFQVRAEADRLQAVTVVHGRVEVRPRAHRMTVLAAGESWRVPPVHTAVLEPPPPPPVPAVHPAHVVAHVPAPVPPVEPPPTAEPPPAAAPPPAPPPKPVPAPAPPSVGDVAYEAGWDAMRAQDFAKAADAFARVLLLAPDSALVEDAAYWHAVALARGKRVPEATVAFRDFLDTHGRSPRAGAASAMLGWILVDAGAFDEALRRFQAASADRDPAVRGSAQAGITALGKRKR